MSRRTPTTTLLTTWAQIERLSGKLNTTCAWHEALALETLTPPTGLQSAIKSGQLWNIGPRRNVLTLLTMVVYYFAALELGTQALW